MAPPNYGSERVVPVPTALTEMLSEHVREVGTQGDDAWLFFRGTDRLNRNSAGNYWRSAREAAGIADFTLHDLRHFYASALIAAGCDVVTVERARGHSSATITLGIYAHLWPTAEDRTRAAATDLMRDVLANPAGQVRTGSTNQPAEQR